MHASKLRCNTCMLSCEHGQAIIYMSKILNRNEVWRMQLWILNKEYESDLLKVKVSL